MSDVLILHNPRCSKSRAAWSCCASVASSRASSTTCAKAADAEQLAHWVALLGVPVREALRREEVDYARLALDDPALSDAELIAAAIAHPHLIQRPLVGLARAAIGAATGSGARPALRGIIKPWTSCRPCNCSPAWWKPAATPPPPSNWRSRALASKLVQALEDQLGVRLLHRTTCRLSLTEAGQNYYQRVAEILAQLAEAEAEAAELQLEPRGRLRVSAPMSSPFCTSAPPWPTSSANTRASSLS